MTHQFWVMADPVPAPRQTRRDIWNPRPCVLRYRTFKDVVRMSCPKPISQCPTSLDCTFFIPMPQSWSDKKKKKMLNTPCRVRPDVDNLLKAIADALWPDGDGMIHVMIGKKVWANPGQGKVYVCFQEEPLEGK